jgi:cystathionine gamma-synthase
MTKRPLHPRSLAAQAMGKVDPQTKGVVHADPCRHDLYPRRGQRLFLRLHLWPARQRDDARGRRAVLAMLEEAKAGALLFGSGMAAATAVFQALSPGDHVVASKVMYWATARLAADRGDALGPEDRVRRDRRPRQAMQAAVKPGVTKLVWAETPSNPLWTITDIAALAEIAQAAGAKLAVDSTCASPVHTRPLTLGADIVMHAATKVLNGHSDVVAGVLCAREDDEFWARIKTVRKGQGGILGPFEAYLLMRGLRTLHVRQERQSGLGDGAGAAAVGPPAGRTRALSRPAAASRPRHRRAPDGGRLRLSCSRSRSPAARSAAVRQTARTSSLYKRATSLGGVESLIEHRASIEGAGSPCPPDLLRLSTGIEDIEDLYADLDQALRAGHRLRAPNSEPDLLRHCARSCRRSTRPLTPAIDQLGSRATTSSRSAAALQSCGRANRRRRSWSEISRMRCARSGSPFEIDVQHQRADSGLIIRPASELEDAAAMVARAVAGLGVAEIGAAFVFGELLLPTLLLERPEAVGLMRRLGQEMTDAQRRRQIGLGGEPVEMQGDVVHDLGFADRREAREPGDGDGEVRLPRSFRLLVRYVLGW